jgi:hypothetical protein
MQDPTPGNRDVPRICRARVEHGIPSAGGHENS